VVSTIHHEHSAAIFSPDGDELFWTVHAMPLQGPTPAVVLHMRRENGVWTPPRVARFSGLHDDDVCSISPDGRRLYISSRRPPVEGGEPLSRSDIYVMDRAGAGWGEPRPLGPAINTPHHESGFQETRSGAAYFVGHLDGVAGRYGIYRAARAGDGFVDAEPLGPHINSESNDWCPYVDPDERFLLFSSNRPGGFGRLDLYISFRQPDGTWGEPVNLGPEINTGDNERFPFLSPDGSHLFFTSKRVERGEGPEEPLTLQDLQDAHERVANGLGNIYWVSASILQELERSPGP
jgi:hypothetical protein